MITKEEIELSKKSYTDRDFASIYPDLLDLAKQLTNSWDPSSSNESDPGVVLLKEGAFIADHNNYNIDKNVLENFLPSATQETSVRNLVEMNGYTPRYYVSATGTVNFSYNRGTDTEATEFFLVKPFTIQISNAEGDVTYTQIGDLSVNAENSRVQCEFMEGTLSTLSVNGVENITLDNLDDNNRLYFPVKYVAENGVFISNTLMSGKINYDFWTRTNYLLTQPLGSKVYKLDYDSSMGLPYIEFPSDISNIIGSGLTVRYMVTTGANGNVSACTLSKIISPATIINAEGNIEVPVEYLTLSNPSSILNGKDPETIDEMYQSFKKVVGTFDTLVTCKDFQDAIYMLQNDNMDKIVSNDIVTDIKTDYNRAIKVVSYDEYGAFFKNISLTNGLGRLKFQAEKPENPEVGDLIIEDGIIKWYSYNKLTSTYGWAPLNTMSYDDFVLASEAITPFDIVVYALTAFSLSDYYPYYPAYALNKSFTPAENDEQNNDADPYDDIRASLNEYKCINHQFNTPRQDDVICFKNYVPLNVTITPYSKVTAQEKDEILNSVYRALSVNFNAAMVDFGEELNYDAVYAVILNADDRIKSVRLEDFEYSPKALICDNTASNTMWGGSGHWREVDLFDSEAGLFIDLVAKNVLAGRICLFNFDETFDYEYGQVGSTSYHNVAKITSEVKIHTDEIIKNQIQSSESDGLDSIQWDDTEYQLINNEFVQIAWPNYFTDITYPTYVYYNYNGANVSSNQEYMLQAGERIIFVWTQNNQTQRKTYGPGEVIRPNFLLTNTENIAYYTKEINTHGDTEQFALLKNNEQIEHRILLSTILSSKNTPVYWIRQGGKLFGSESEVVLNSGEYFIYSNPTLDSMVIFGAGTCIQRDPNDTEDWDIIESEANISTINNEGFNADISWQWRDFSVYNLVIKEMNLLTLGSGDIISITPLVDAGGEIIDPGLSDIGNEWQTFHAQVNYTINSAEGGGSETTIESALAYRIRSRLDMTSDKHTPQILYRNQSVTIEYSDEQGSHTKVIGGYENTSESDAPKVYYQISAPVDILGDSTIDISELTKEYNLPDISVREFMYESPVIVNNEQTSESDTEYEEFNVINGNVYLPMPFKSGTAILPISYENTFSSLSVDNTEYVVPIFIDISHTPDFVVPIYAYVTGDLGNLELTNYGRPDLDKHFSSSEIPDGLILENGGYYMLNIVVPSPFDTSESSEQIDEEVTVKGTIYLNLAWSATTVVQEFISVLKYRIITGLNKNLPGDYFSLNDVMGRINDLLASSNDSSTVPYLTYEPEQSMAIQNENLADPTTLWDHNNVANHITIAQVDIENSNIDIIKSMRNYK